MGDLRNTARRKADVLATLEGQAHAWLATASGSLPHVIVTQAVWDGESIVVTTRQRSRTARNLVESKVGRLAFGDADDAILVDVELVNSLAAADGAQVNATFERAAGWNPAAQGTDWWLFVLRPTRIQAYRGYGEIEGRDVMKDGRWLA
jgi:hypothetical protein